jgi:WD40 repeat protein
MITTPDNKFLFAGSRCGNLKQICLEIKKVVYDYGTIHCDVINCLQIKRDSKYLITGGWDGRVKRI